MPEICRFFGIVIRMFFDEHGPPHFHAVYGRHRVSIAIRGPSVLSGSLPARALGMALEWAALHREELQENWDRMRDAQPPHKLPPLQ